MGYKRLPSKEAMQSVPMQRDDGKRPSMGEEGEVGTRSPQAFHKPVTETGASPDRVIGEGLYRRPNQEMVYESWGAGGREETKLVGLQ